MVVNSFTPPINFIKFTKLYNWSVQYLLEETITYNIELPLVPIGTFLKRNKTVVEVKNGIWYKRVTIKTNNGGVILRDTEKGDKIGTKNQFIIKEGQFLVSKIDARNGAFGVVTKEVNEAIITGNFWAFDVDYELINPHYLTLITTTPEFISFCNNSSTGTTNRHYLQEDLFLQVEIPLPPIDEKDAIRRNLSNDITQEKLVAAYNQKLKEADEARQNALKMEAQIDGFIVGELGIDQAKIGPVTTGLMFAKFKSLDRWDIWASKSLSSSSAYSFLKFREVLNGKPVYGANVKGVTKKSDTRYIRITDINEDGSLNEDIVYPEFVEEKYLLKENDFLIARSGNTVGKTFLYKSFMGRAIYAGYLVKYDLNQEMVLPEYVLAFTKSSMFKKWVNSNQRVSGQPNINGQEYLEFPIIVPDKNTQKRIVSEIDNIRGEIKKQNEIYNQLRKRAILDFEHQIFKTEL